MESNIELQDAQEAATQFISLGEMVMCGRAGEVSGEVDKTQMVEVLYVGIEFGLHVVCRRETVTILNRRINLTESTLHGRKITLATR